LLEILSILPGSTAARMGLKPGDSVISVNGEEIHDVIDFRFFSADERLSLAVQKKSGSLIKLKVSKEPDDNLGLEFAPLRIKRCRNKCIFCFVDQMPPGCRKTLYVKDDDFRASFLHGNFITLDALSESDWERIFRLRLSPLYISVHSTDAGLRASLLRNTKAPDILESLKRLASGGIKMHTQVVLCPGVNDKEHLKRTITDLAGLFPAVSSIAVVPVGITRFRKGLFPLRIFSRQEARAVLERIEPLARRFKKRFGTRLVFASDEFYIKANVQFPPPSFYEDFPQIENGVGLVATFMGEVSRTRLPTKIVPVRATVVTGVSFSKILSSILKRLKGMKGAVVRQVTVKNRFFGPSVTVTGLLTGGDILHALRGKRLGDMVLIPSSALKEDGDVFLDDMSVEELERQLKTKVSRVDGFRDLIAVLRGRRRGEQ
jgi:putative radical SAM enzyme (TIGR03279 family)